MTKEVGDVPTEMGLSRAVTIYSWRALGFVLTFAPAAVIYVLALVVTQFGKLPSPKTTLTLTVVTFAAVAGACYGIGLWVHERISQMPAEVAVVIKPFIFIVAVVGAVVALPVFVVYEVFN